MKDSRNGGDPGNSANSGSDRSDEDLPTSVWAEQGKYLGYGMNFALALVLFFFLGLWLDSKLGTTPWLALLGAFFGGGAGFYNLYAHIILEPAAKNSRSNELGEGRENEP
jgi:ATP synthase protein I